MEAENRDHNYTSDDELPETVISVFEDLQIGKARKLRYTGLFVTLNTNLSPQKISVSQFKEYLETVLFTKDALPPLLGLKENQVVEIDIQAPGIEISPKTNRVHCHFTLVCQHYDKIYLQGLQKRWQKFVTITLPVHSYGVYCSIELLDYSAENYALKNSF